MIIVKLENDGNMLRTELPKPTDDLVDPNSVMPLQTSFTEYIVRSCVQLKVCKTRQ